MSARIATPPWHPGVPAIVHPDPASIYTPDPAYATVPPLPAEPPPLTPLQPSRHAIVVVAVVERCTPGNAFATCHCPPSASPKSSSPLVHVNHVHAPNHPHDDPAVSLAKDAIAAAGPFIFPPDIPCLSDPVAPHQTFLHHPHDTTPNRPVTAPHPAPHPPPIALPRSSATIPTSPLSDSPPPTLANLHQPAASIPFEAARTLPLSAVAVYDALAEPASEPGPGSLRLTPSARPSRPRTRASRSFTAPSSSTEVVARRSHSLPRRPATSPPPRIHSTGIPSLAPREPLRHRHAEAPPQLPQLSLQATRRQFRFVLLTSKTHVFAITARDGSRQYAYCRPLSPVHSLVVLTNLSHTAVYVSAMERTAARYAYLVDESLGEHSHPPYTAERDLSADSRHVMGAVFGRETGEPLRSSTFLNYDIMRCPPVVAKELTSSLLDWLDTASPNASRDFVAESVKTPNLFTSLDCDDADVDDVDVGSDGDNHSTTWLTSSTTSSGLSASATKGAGHFALRPRNAQDISQERDMRTFWGKDRDTSSGVATSSSRSTSSLPWELAAESEESDSSAVMRVLELADATLLFRHFTVRTIVSILVAILEERRVCVVGPSTSIVSRAVLVFVNLVRPFEWPHLLSPILLEHMLPVLGAPFPFLVGILDCHYPQAKELPLDDVVFADLTTGKVTSVGGPGELYRHVPRRIRSRFERRLARAKTACTRQIYRARSLLFTPAVSNTATSFLKSDPFDELSEKAKTSLLWRSRSSLKLLSDAVPQNIWLEHETVASVDKAMRKFFAELLDGVRLSRQGDGQDGANFSGRPDNGMWASASTPASVAFGSLKKEAERRQLAKAFCDTQMYMLWKESESCDVTFGVSQTATEASSRKRATLRELSLQARKPSLDSHENDIAQSPIHSPRQRPRVTSDLDDVFSGEEGVPLTEDPPVRKKRFRSRRKNRRRHAVRLHFNSEVEEFDVAERDAQSDVEEEPLKPVEPQTGPLEVELRQHTGSTECEVDSDAENMRKRPWLSLRLPSSPWTLGRDLGMFSSKEEDEETGDLSEQLGERSGEEETDGFGDPEDVLDIHDMFPSEDVGAGWTRMRHWSRRRYKHSARA